MHRVLVFAAVAGMSVVLAACVSAPETAPAVTPPPTDGFFDAVHHWQNRYGNSYARHDLSEVGAIADNILLMQRDHGGWVQNQDPIRVFTEEARARYLSEKGEAYGSFDNRNVYTQIAYLMGAYDILGDARYREGALRGLDYLLEHQIETCGGWPHSVPASQRYHPYLTIADEVTSGPLILLRQIATRQAPFKSLSEDVRRRAEDALNRGDACVLQLQVRQDNGLAGWAGQYDPETLEPAMGRTFELPSMAVQETVEMLRYLMSVEDPSPEMIAAVEGGISWLQQVAIQDTRLETFELSEPVEFRYHTATYDRRLVDEPGAPALWARFYDVSDNSVVLANRDSIRVSDYQEISQERRTGYNWYGYWAASLLTEDYPDWRARIAR